MCEKKNPIPPGYKGAGAIHCFEWQCEYCGNENHYRGVEAIWACCEHCGKQISAELADKLNPQK